MTALPLHRLKQFLHDHVFKSQTVKYVPYSQSHSSQHLIKPSLLTPMWALCHFIFSFNAS